MLSRFMDMVLLLSLLLLLLHGKYMEKLLLLRDRSADVRAVIKKKKRKETRHLFSCASAVRFSKHEGQVGALFPINSKQAQ